MKLDPNQLFATPQEFADALGFQSTTLMDNAFIFSLFVTLDVFQGRNVSNPNVRGYTDGRAIYLTEAWWNATDDEQYNTLAHELGHIALKHVIRGAGYDNHNKANIAADLALIQFQEDMGCRMDILNIKSVVDDWYDYVDLSFDEIYHKLKDEDWPDDPSHDWDPDADPGLSDDLDDKIISAAQTASQAGQSSQLTDDILRAFAKKNSAKIPWNHYLRKAVKGMNRRQPSPKPHRRMAGSGIYVPGFDRAPAFEAVVAVDTSGSVGDESLAAVLAEIVEITNQFTEETLVLPFDDHMYEPMTVKRGVKPEDIKVKGYGGTYLDPVYEHIRTERPKTKLLIVATDGWLDQPEPPRGTHIIWLITDRRSFTSEHGHPVIHVYPEDL